MSILQKLPDMFVMNLPRDECHNTEGEDMVLPEPGESKETGKLAKPGTKTGGPGCASVTKKGRGAGTLTPPSKPTGNPVIEPNASGTPTTGPAHSSATLTSPPYSPASVGEITPPVQSSGFDSTITMTLTETTVVKATGGVPDSGRGGADIGKSPSVSKPTKVPGSAACPNDPESISMPTIVSQSPARPTAPAVINTAPYRNSTTGGHSGVSCDKEGAIICIGDTQFGICNRGTAIPQSLAAGTACKDGKIDHANKPADRKHPRDIIHRHRGHHGHRLL